MGWWSDDIMGGDTPLDIESIIYDALEIEKYPDGNYNADVKIPADKFDYDKIVKYLNNREKDGYWLKGDTGNIFHQVLGVMMMGAGAPINKTLKNKMIKAAEQDEWARESDDRKNKMDSFIATLKDYDDTPTKIKSVGLMETIAKGIAPKVYSELDLMYCVSEVAAKLGYAPTSDKMKEFNDATAEWIKENK